MKYYNKIGLIITIFSLFHMGASACEIKLNVNEKFQKDTYSTSDVIVVDVKIVLDHRDCNVDIADTKITSTGSKIVGATKWKEEKPNVFTRKLKVQVGKGDKGNSKIICKRACDKDGGFGALEFKVN